MVKSEITYPTRRRFLSMMTAMAAGLASSCSIPSAVNIFNPQTELSDIVEKEIFDEPQYVQDQKVNHLVNLLKNWAGDYYNSCELNPEKDKTAQKLYQEAIAYGKEIGLNVQRILEKPKTVTIPELEYTKIEEVIEKLEKQGVVLYKSKAIGFHKDEIILGTFDPSTIKKVDYKGNNHNEIIFNDLLQKEERDLPIKSGNFWTFERSYMNLQAIYTGADVFEKQGKSIQERVERGEKLEDFGDQIYLRAYRRLNTAAKENKTSFQEEYANLMVQTRMRHHEPEHRYDSLTITNSKEQFQYDETRAFLNEIANSDFNDFEFGFIAKVYGDLLPKFFNLFEEQGYSKKDLLDMNNRERANIAKEIYNKVIN